MKLERWFNKVDIKIRIQCLNWNFCLPICPLLQLFNNHLLSFQRNWFYLRKKLDSSSRMDCLSYSIFNSLKQIAIYQLRILCIISLSQHSFRLIHKIKLQWWIQIRFQQLRWWFYKLPLSLICFWYVNITNMQNQCVILHL